MAGDSKNQSELQQEAFAAEEAVLSMTEAKLTNAERLLLEWLSKEESSALGECRGRDLQVLIEAGLAELGPYPFVSGYENYRRVYLTEAGRAALRQGEGK